MNKSIQNSYYQQQLRSKSITYRNGLYQGSIDGVRQTRSDFGIIYLAKTHQLVCCNNWRNDFLEGQSLFYNSDRRYVYGPWINNLPQGFNVFRFDQILFMAQFNRGKLTKNTPILIVFQKYNIAAILIVTNQCEDIGQIQLQVFLKQQVYSSQDLNSLFKQCQWPQDYFKQNQTLIKYISNKLVSNVSNGYPNITKSKPDPVKLRLIQNKYYRFGYDQGLAIIFDQDFNRISVGHHIKSKLKSFGVVFDRQSNQKNLWQGKIKKIQGNTLHAVNNKNKASNFEIPGSNKQYKVNLLRGVNFCNKFYKNPSKIFQFLIENLLNHHLVRNLISGSLSTRRLLAQESLDFSKIEQLPANNLSTQALFRKNQSQKPESFSLNANKHQGSVDYNKDKFINDRLRLSQIKKEIYSSIQKKHSAVQRQVRNQEQRRCFINRQIVGQKGEELRRGYHTPQKTIYKSRSRKRIFEESQKNLKLLKDFTPSRPQQNLTPFKTKMKGRIFRAQANKTEDDRQYLRKEQVQERSRRRKNKEDKQARSKRGQSKLSSSMNSEPRQSRSTNKRDSHERSSKFLRENSQITCQDRLENENSFVSKSSINSSKNHAFASKSSIQGSKNHVYVPINPNQVRLNRKVQQTNARSKQNLDSQTLANYFGSEDKHSQINGENGQSQHHVEFSLVTAKENGRSSSEYYVGQKHKKQRQRQGTQQVRDSEVNNSKCNPNRRNKHTDDFERELKEQMKSRKVKKQDNDDVQNTFGQRQDNSTQNNKQLSQSRKTAFKHSNQVYLTQKYPSPLRRQNTQNNTSKNSHKDSNKKNSSHNMGYGDNQRQRQSSNNSYMNKHKLKKSVERQISKSPDRFRCYGKKSNNPYLESSANCSQELSYKNGLAKGRYQYDSPYINTQKQTVKFPREIRDKFF